MKSYGALGVSFIILGFLGYVTTIIVIIGAILVLVDAYTSHMFYKDVEHSKNALLTINTLLWYNISNDEECVNYVEDD